MIGRRISGVWASANGAVSLELLPNGRFEEHHDGELVFELGSAIQAATL